MPSGSPSGWPPIEPRSILEVGCGYGKLLRELRRRLDVPLVGVDFSPTQLEQARRFLGRDDEIELLLGRGEHLPFPDRSFDMVVTSAVILHNPPPVAERIRREVLRVARRFAAHNEETSVELQPLRLRYRRLVSRPGHRPGRVGTDPDGPRPAVLAVLRRRARAWPSDRRRRVRIPPRPDERDHMIDLGFAAFLAMISMGVGKRILDRLGQTPEHPLDAVALALPLGMGLMALGDARARRARLPQPDRPVGPAGRADRAGPRPLAAACSASCGGWSRIAARREPERSTSGRIIAGLPGAGPAGHGAWSRSAPVTDGDALCYHLQVPKVFLMRGCGRVRARPARDGLSAGDGAALRGRARVSRAGGLPLDPVGPGPGARRQRDGAGAARAWAAGPGGPARSCCWCRRSPTGCRPRSTTWPWPHSARRRSSPGPGCTIGPSADGGGRRGPARRAGDRREVPGPGPGRPAGAGHRGCERLDGRSPRDRCPRPSLARRWRPIYCGDGGRWSAAGGICAPTSTRAIPSIRSSATSSAGRGSTRCSTRSSGRWRSRPGTCCLALGAALAPARSVRQLLAPVRPDLPAVPAGGPARAAAPPRARPGGAGLPLPDALPDPAPEHAVRPDRAGTDVGRGGVRPGERLVRSQDGPGAAAGRRCCWRPWGSRRAWRSRGPGTSLGLVAGRESAESLLSRREPTYAVGRWAARQPARDGPADRSGPPRLLHPAPLHDGAGPSPTDRAGPPRRSRRARSSPACASRASPT